jgi:VWFA-related protein
MTPRTLLLAGLSCLLVSQQPPVFRIATEAVRVDVLVTDGRKPIAGLTSGDFELRDSGVLQSIADVGVAEVPFSMLLALDTSSSMAGAPLEQLQQAARAAIQALGPGDRAALMPFTEAIVKPTAWTDDRARLLAAIDHLESAGATSLYDAAFAALQQRDHDRRQLLILFTDGSDTQSWLPAGVSLDLARRTETVVFSVALSSGFRAAGASAKALHGDLALERRSGIRLTPQQPVLSSQDFLHELAARTGGDELQSSVGGLRAAFERIVTTFRTRYVLAYTPEAVPATGWHPIDVRLKNRRATVTARPGYQR